MVLPPALLRVAGVLCLLCVPSTAFAPRSASSVLLQNQRHQEYPCSTAPHSEDNQRRRHLPRKSLRHSPSSAAVRPTCRQPQRQHSAELRAGEGGGASDRGEFLARVASGATAATAGCAAAAAVGLPEEAGAFCGEPYPYWAYFTDFDEVFVPFKFEGYSGKLFARTVGNGKEQNKAQHNPLVIIPGGPGLPHDYLETLEGAAKDDRVVLLFDPVGTGNSTALPVDVAANAPGLLRTASLVAQTAAVVDYFKVNTYHVLGHGTGAEAALALGKSMGKASPRPPGPELEAVISVTLASPVLGDNELPSDFLETLRAPYSQDGNEPPLCLTTALDGRSADGFAGGLVAMKQERRSTGGVTAAGAVGSLSCPALVTYGKRDIVGDEVVASIKQGLSGGGASVEVKRFDGSGHLAHLDEREEYVTLLQNFLTSVDDSWAGKNGGTQRRK